MFGQIEIEFYGTVRTRAGEPSYRLCLAGQSISLGQVCHCLAHRFPELTGFCFDSHGQLTPGFVVNVDGREFTRDPRRPLHAGQTLMLLTADVGG